MRRLDVEQMLDELSWEQFCGWLADYRQGRWGEERADLRTGSILSLYANAHKKRGTRAYKPADFIPMFEAPQPTDCKVTTDPDAWAAMIADKKHRVAQQARGSYREVN